MRLEALRSFLLRVFFVLTGMKVDGSSFSSFDVLGFAGVLVVADVHATLACALVVPRPLAGLAVGLGMIPRGEVGFIFASIGTTLYLHGQAIVPPTVFAAAILAVILTTLPAPPLLSARLRATQSGNGRPPSE